MTLAALPKHIAGYDVVETLVIDDGSTDDTAALAKQLGVTKVFSHLYNRGLAAAYITGLEQALAMGAHTIVNVDADNQYNATDIEPLVAPIRDRRGHVVIGERPLDAITHFSAMKKNIHRVGNVMIRFISGLDVRDATSGFRALHRDIASQITIYSSYTYTIEMLILLGSRNIPVIFIPVRVNGEMRPSRLIRSNWQYIRKSSMIVLRSFFIYRPMLMCGYIATICGLGALGFGTYYSYHHEVIAALVTSSVLVVCSVSAIFMAFLCDAVRAVRVLNEQARSRELLQSTLNAS